MAHRGGYGRGRGRGRGQNHNQRQADRDREIADMRQSMTDAQWEEGIALGFSVNDMLEMYRRYHGPNQPQQHTQRGDRGQGQAHSGQQHERGQQHPPGQAQQQQPPPPPATARPTQFTAVAADPFAVPAPRAPAPPTAPTFGQATAAAAAAAAAAAPRPPQPTGVTQPLAPPQTRGGVAGRGGRGGQDGGRGGRNVTLRDRPPINRQRDIDWIEATIADVPNERLQLPPAARARAEEIANRLEKAINEGTLRAHNLHLIGPVTNTDLHTVATTAHQQGGQNGMAAAVRAMLDWWRDNGFNHACARQCALALPPSSGSIPCHDCQVRDAVCYFKYCQKQTTCAAGGCNLLHYTEIILIAAAFCKLGMCKREAIELARRFLDSHEWYLPTAYYHRRNMVKHPYDLPPKGSAKVEKPGARHREFEHSIDSDQKHLADWVEALDDAAKYIDKKNLQATVVNPGGAVVAQQLPTAAPVDIPTQWLRSNNIPPEVAANSDDLFRKHRHLYDFKSEAYRTWKAAQDLNEELAKTTGMGVEDGASQAANDSRDTLQHPTQPAQPKREDTIREKFKQTAAGEEVNSRKVIGITNTIHQGDQSVVTPDPFGVDNLLAEINNVVQTPAQARFVLPPPPSLRTAPVTGSTPAPQSGSTPAPSPGTSSVPPPPGEAEKEKAGKEHKPGQP